FAVIAVLWYLLSCRKLPKGWFASLLAFLGFANGLAPWAVRNYQVFGEIVPIADSAFWHLWMGNNPQATGGPLDENSLRPALPPDRLQALRGEHHQPGRYLMLAQDVIDEVIDDPGNTLARRLWAGLYFFFGEAWFKDRVLSLPARSETQPQLPAWLEETYPGM